MAIGPEGTFNYTFEIDEGFSSTRRVQGKLTEPARADRQRLVGHSPIFEALEYQREPWQLYARITLRATDRPNATIAAASFSVDRGLVTVLRSSDVLHLCRTGCGGLGLSIIRDGYLVAAAGAVGSVPLGNDVSARSTWDLVQQAEAIFRTRDPDYHMREHPVELSIAGETRIMHGGAATGPYDVRVRHGFILGLPGTDPCVSIERRGVCPDTAAHTTAQLFEEENLQMSEWASLEEKDAL